MDTHLEESSPIDFPANVMQLGERHSVVFHLRDGLPWVAEFRGGRAELIDAAAWWRWVPPSLASHRGRAAALATLAPLDPELGQHVEALHRDRHAAKAARNPGHAWTALKRWCEAVAARCGVLRRDGSVVPEET